MMSFLRYVGKFIPRKEELGHHTRSTNVFVKNFGEDFTEDQLRETFSVFGMITSAVVLKDDQGKGRGCGFVSYEDHEAASKVSSPRRPFLTYCQCCVVCINVCVHAGSGRDEWEDCEWTSHLCQLGSEEEGETDGAAQSVGC